VIAFTPPRCAVHPAALAPFRCDACARSLCELCTAPTAAGKGTLACCASCGAFAQLELAPREVAQPFRESWPRTLWALANPLVLALILIVTCCTEYLGQTSWRGWVLGHAIELGWFLLIVRRAGRGHEPFSAPTYSDLGSIWTGPCARLLLSVGPLMLGAMLLVELGQRAVSPRSLVLWILFALAVWLVPPALICACAERTQATWLMPWELRANEKLLGRDVQLVRAFAAVWLLLMTLKAMQPVIIHGDAQMGSKIEWAVALQLPAVMLLAMLGCVLGHFLRTRGEELGHGDPEDWRVPLDPEAQPRGVRAQPQAKIAARDREPSERTE
jgi:hypothetical protein